jgi:hypothetical protein
MKNEDFFRRGLPKWPAIVVVGKPVTKAQAAEILIRTDTLNFSTNDREFRQQLESYFYDVKFEDPYEDVYDAVVRKLGLEKENFREKWEYVDKIEREVGQIPLEYLTNSQIVSAYIGGPHGWCNWEGMIGCKGHNIGKWPNVETVYDEWKRIAKEFPFLELRCQLMGHEAGYSEDGEDHPVVEYVVKGGKVRMVEPKAPLATTHGVDEDTFANLFTPGRERGCTFEQFKRAVEQVRQKYQTEKV